MKKEHMRTFLKQTENAEKVLLSPFMIMQVYLYYMQNMCWHTKINLEDNTEVCSI